MEQTISILWLLRYHFGDFHKIRTGSNALWENTAMLWWLNCQNLRGREVSVRLVVTVSIIVEVLKFILLWRYEISVASDRCMWMHSKCSRKLRVKTWLGSRIYGIRKIYTIYSVMCIISTETINISILDMKLVWVNKWFKVLTNVINEIFGSKASKF